MNINEILELTRAGWSKDEILLLAQTQTPDAEKIEHPTEKEEPKEEPKQEPKPEPKPEPVESETDKLIKALGLKLDNAVAAMHKSNVNNLEGDTANVLTAEDVIAQIINPKYTKEEKNNAE